jgi:ribosomal RNA assembly protein
MQQVQITAERLKALWKERGQVALVERICRCKISIDQDGLITISGEDGFGEFVAKNILFAYGRGFEMKHAELLEKDDYYFLSIDLGQLFGSEKRVKQMKARVIGESGKTKTYIEGVSGAKLSIYGDTISFIGSQLQIEEAKTAVDTLLNGGAHKTAYLKMEAAHRKNKAKIHDATF